MPATTTANEPRLVGSLAALIDSGKQRGNHYEPLHRSEQAAILLALASAELDAVHAHGGAAAAAAGGGGFSPRRALGAAAQVPQRGSGACGDDTPAARMLRDPKNIGDAATLVVRPGSAAAGSRYMFTASTERHAGQHLSPLYPRASATARLEHDAATLLVLRKPSSMTR